MEIKLSITELLAKRLLDRMVKRLVLSRTDYLKCKLGLEVFLINLTKLTIIYSLACLVQLPVEVFIFHSGFMLIRFFAYGAHSSSSIVCTTISCVLFIGIPALLQLVTVSVPGLLLANLINLLILFKYAPGKTKKNYIGDEQRQRKLKRNALVVNIVMLAGILIFDLFISNLFIFGGLLCGVLVLPISNKLLTFDFKSLILLRKWRKKT